MCFEINGGEPDHPSFSEQSSQTDPVADSAAASPLYSREINGLRPVFAARIKSSRSGSNNTALKQQWHPEVEILKATLGDFDVELNLETTHVQKGDMFFFNPGDIHQIIAGSDQCEHEVVAFLPDILSFTYQDAMQTDLVGPFIRQETRLASVIHPDSIGYEDISRIENDLFGYASGQKDGWYLRFKTSLMDFLLQMYENGYILDNQANTSDTASHKKIAAFKKVVSYMDNNYAHKITLSQLANEADYNPQYFCHFFRDITGTTPINYLLELRLDKARELICTTNESIQNIAAACGFDNMSYFIRVFKKTTGLTPTQYRRQALSRQKS